MEAKVVAEVEVKVNEVSDDDSFEEIYDPDDEDWY